MNIRIIRYGLWAAIAVLCLFLVAASGFGKFQSGQQTAELGVPFNLVDQDGKPMSEKAFEGHPSVLFFGFTHCPDICPTTLYELAGWLGQLGEEGKDLRAFFITVDPERDTPEVMKAYTGNFTDRITGITGDPAEMAKLIAGWKIYARKVPLDDGGYTMDHTASVFLLDRNGRFKGTIAYGESAETALQKLKRLIAG
ncbi:SCO family protein [Phyllobacterium phragmitis]|uniref:SCO family protein n=1 Tax=Phyllobacterium phragmitis TaxID=2670329 RepID=A0A2S9IS99_9HYPH|nr:SCO family protein [Phyllobacterium phragmitis]PRD43401.1 SCO family protein [Phyllobacterium phragmitis]